MADGIFDILTCRPKLIIKHANNLDYVTLETKTVTDAPSPSTITLDISENIRLPCAAPSLSRVQLVSYLWGFQNGVWLPVDLMMPHGQNYIRFKDTTYGNFSNLSIVTIDDVESDHDPILACSSGMVVKKDFSAGGFVTANQGLIALGSGMKNQFDPPGAWMIHSGMHALHDIQTATSPPSVPSGKKPYYINSNNNHLYWWNGSTWTDQGHKDKYNYYFDTFYIRKAFYTVQVPPSTDGRPIPDSDLANLACNNIRAAGFIHAGGSSGPAFQVGDDIYIVDYNQANKLSLRGAQNSNEAGIQFGNNGPTLYRQNNYLICESPNPGSGGFSTNGYLSFGYLANGSQGPLYRNSSSGQIGTYSSSERYKDNVKAIDDCSWIYNLRPVSFDWKDKDRAKTDGTQVGLIAEEVHKYCPQFTWCDDEGKLEGVHYEWLGVPLLVELKKLRKEVDELKAKLAT
ncbi:MAG: tail fiber domain-containing protein [Nitrososphaerota archaeon]|jgi:hypothetical protein|nr:tail fiber domain-containing protein [Nitrososphaerota archaeon]